LSLFPRCAKQVLIGGVSVVSTLRTPRFCATARARTPPCEACGAHHTELHHFAPRAVFDAEADLSPQSSLCRPCQARWHRVMAASVPLT
jgi:hypothetical protein